MKLYWAEQYMIGGGEAPGEGGAIVQRQVTGNNFLQHGSSR